jgi:hypothetical protein
LTVAAIASFIMINVRRDRRARALRTPLEAANG